MRLIFGLCATCGKPVPGGGHTDQCTGLVPGSEYEIDLEACTSEEGGRR